MRFWKKDSLSEIFQESVTTHFAESVYAQKHDMMWRQSEPVISCVAVNQ